MKTRMEKYRDTRVSGNRTERNKELYKEVNKADLEITKSYSNTRVIDEANTEIDIDKIKRYIEKMNDNTTSISRTKINDIETPNYETPMEEVKKDYDINSVLEKARSKREVDYGEERSKKVNIKYEELLAKIEKFNKDHGPKEDMDEDDSLNTNEKKIVDLFNTIKINKEEASLFDDLKATENTQVLGNIEDMADDESFKDEIKKQLSETDSMVYEPITSTVFTLTESDKEELLKDQIKEELEKVEELKEDTKEVTVDTNIINVTNSFYTTGDVFNKKDFVNEEDNEDEEWDDYKSSPAKTIGLVIAVIVLLAILVVVINYVFKLGLF